MPNQDERLGFDDMIMNGEKISFSRTMFDIGRLESIFFIWGELILVLTTQDRSYLPELIWFLVMQVRHIAC